MDLNKLCIATIIKENLNFNRLPNTLKEKILQFRPCCLSICTNKVTYYAIITAIRVDHPDCLKTMLSIYKRPSILLMAECIHSKSYKCILYLLSIDYNWPDWTIDYNWPNWILNYVQQFTFLKFCIQNNCMIHPNIMDDAIKYLNVSYPDEYFLSRRIDSDVVVFAKLLYLTNLPFEVAGIEISSTLTNMQTNHQF